MNDTKNLEAYYGLPQDVIFCNKCVMTNQRPASAIEFKHTRDSKKTSMNLDEEGVCDACRNAEQKDNINWEEREKELLKLFNFFLMV